MAWNRGSEGATPVKAKAKPSPIRGIVAGLVVVVAVCVAYFAFFSSSEKSQTENAEKERGRIKEVAPAATPKAAEPLQTPKKPKRIPYWDQPTTNGLTDVQIRIWKLHRNPPPYTNRVTTAKPPFAIFPTRAENEIACLMTLEPGEGLVGDGFYGEKFKQEFLKSCEVPIIATDEDTEYQRKLKADMNQIKIELRQRMADGEDLGKILSDTRKEIQRMAQVKQQLESEVRKMIREDAQSEADIDSYVEAANKMLEGKGIAPLKLNPLTRRALKRAIEKKAK